MPKRCALRLFVFAWFLATLPAAQAGSSNSLLDLSPDGKTLLATNTDNGTITVVDIAARKALREIEVGDRPECVAWIGAGPLAVVTLYRDNQLAFVDVVAGKVLSKLTIGAEPYGVVITRDGRRAYVTQEYPGTVTEIDLEARKVLRSFKAGSMVRGIALSPDEKRIYVTEFLTAALIALDRETGKVLDRWQAHTEDNLCRNVVIHPTRPKAYVSHTRSRIEVIHGNGSIVPHLTIYDLVAANNTPRFTSFAMDTFNGVYVVTNPWEAALSPDGTRLYTIYAGTNDMNVAQVIDDDYREIKRLGRAATVGQNPRAIRVSPDGKTVYVLNALDFDVRILDANSLRLLDQVKLCDPPKSPEWVRGKILFSTARHPMSLRGWVACSSCHPDGASDGRIWHNPEGLRKTPSLAGLAHTHPLHWSADRDEVQDFEYTIRGKLMQGAGLLRGSIKPKNGPDSIELEEHLSGRSKDLDALAIYTNSFDPVLSPHIPAPGKLSEPAQRGKSLFFNDTVGCVKCHNGPYYTDSSLIKPFKLYDVGTGKDDPSEKMGPKYDTPTLLGVYRTAPYLHHGKAATLRDVLTTCNKDDKHGKTSHLKEAEIDDLVEFLKSLPYETPPDETPNTVKYRLQAKKKE